MNKQYSPQFEAKLALEAVEEAKSIAELSGEYKIHFALGEKGLDLSIVDREMMFCQSTR
jgi:hypothetical protein